MVISQGLSLFSQQNQRCYVGERRSREILEKARNAPVITGNIKDRMDVLHVFLGLPYLVDFMPHFFLAHTGDPSLGHGPPVENLCCRPVWLVSDPKLDLGGAVLGLGSWRCFSSKGISGSEQTEETSSELQKPSRGTFRTLNQIQLPLWGSFRWWPRSRRTHIDHFLQSFLYLVQHCFDFCPNPSTALHPHLDHFIISDSTIQVPLLLLPPMIPWTVWTSEAEPVPDMLYKMQKQLWSCSQNPWDIKKFTFRVYYCCWTGRDDSFDQSLDCSESSSTLQGQTGTFGTLTEGC